MCFFGGHVVIRVWLHWMVGVSSSRQELVEEKCRPKAYSGRECIKAGVGVLDSGATTRIG